MVLILEMQQRISYCKLFVKLLIVFTSLTGESRDVAGLWQFDIPFYKKCSLIIPFKMCYPFKCLQQRRERRWQRREISSHCCSFSCIQKWVQKVFHPFVLNMKHSGKTFCMIRGFLTCYIYVIFSSVWHNEGFSFRLIL